MYACFLIFDVDGDFDSVVRSCAIDKEGRSSLLSLAATAESAGLHTLALKNLTPSVLKKWDVPAILHTKRTMQSTNYDHFEIFLGSVGDSILILDPYDGVRWHRSNDLAARWDGTALAVFDGPLDEAQLTGNKREVMTVIAVVIFVATSVVAITRVASKRTVFHTK